MPGDRAVPSWLDRTAYPFDNKWLPLPAGDLHYVDEGQGDPILFSHGTPTWSFEWRHLIRAISATNRCIAPDHLGFGLSDRPAGESYTPEAHAQRLSAFTRALGLGDFTLVVHDYGGPIAFPLALDDRQLVKRLVVINTWMWPLDDDQEIVRVARIAGSPVGKLLYEWVNLSLTVIMPSAYADRRKLTAEIREQYLAPFANRAARGTVLWPLARALMGSTAFYDSLYQKRERLRDIPTLIVWGRRDPAFKPHHLSRWRAIIPNPKVVELPVGHWPHEEDPRAVTNAIVEFLRGS